LIGEKEENLNSKVDEILGSNKSDLDFENASSS
jgi:hypothetical protein